MSDDRAQRIGELTSALNRVDSQYGALADNLFYHSHVTVDTLPELSFQQLCALDVPVRSASRIAAMYHKEEKADPYKEWQKARQERIRQLREYQVQFGSVPWGAHWVPLILYVLIIIISGILGFHVWKANSDLVKAGIGLAFGIAGFCTSFIKSIYCAVALDGGWFTIALCFHKICGLLGKLMSALIGSMDSPRSVAESLLYWWLFQVLMYPFICMVPTSVVCIQYGYPFFSTLLALAQGYYVILGVGLLVLIVTGTWYCIGYLRRPR